MIVCVFVLVCVCVRQRACVPARGSVCKRLCVFVSACVCICVFQLSAYFCVMTTSFILYMNSAILNTVVF